MSTITVTTTVRAPIERVWSYYNTPEHITKWATGSPDWHTPGATNDLRIGGKFNTRMEAKDGSEGFDFVGTYTEVVPNQKIAYTMDDGREVVTTFEEEGNAVTVKTTFDPENENPPEVQREGWQTILDNFKKHVETY